MAKRKKFRFSRPHVGPTILSVFHCAEHSVAKSTATASGYETAHRARAEAGGDGVAQLLRAGQQPGRGGGLRLLSWNCKMMNTTDLRHWEWVGSRHVIS